MESMKKKLKIYLQNLNKKLETRCIQIPKNGMKDKNGTLV